MFHRPLRIWRRLSAVLVLAAIVVTDSMVATPTYAFSLSGTQFVEGLKKAGDTVKAAEEAQRHDKSRARQVVDDQIGKVTDKTANTIERASTRAAMKAWKSLAKSGSKVGRHAKKALMRWGPAVVKGLRLASPVGRVVDTAQAGHIVGTAAAEHIVIPMIDGYFDGKSQEVDERIRLEVMEIRKRGEFGRKLDEHIAALKRETRAMDEEEQRLYGPTTSGAASDPWIDNEGGADRDDMVAGTSNESDSRMQDDAVRQSTEDDREQWDNMGGDVSRQSEGEARGCDDEWGDCPGEEYWNEALQEKARQIDPWAAYREEQRQKMANTENRSDVSPRGCEDGWAHCSGTDWTRGGTSDDRSDIGWSREESYGASSARLRDESVEHSDYDSMVSGGSYEDVLEGLEEEKERRKRAEAERQRKRAEEEHRKREEAERQRERSSPAETTLAQSRSGGTDQQDSEALSSDCDEFVHPACIRAIKTAELQITPLHMALQTESTRPVQKSLRIQIIQIGLVAARACNAAETRRHCKKYRLDGVRQIERTLLSVQQE